MKKGRNTQYCSNKTNRLLPRAVSLLFIAVMVLFSGRLSSQVVIEDFNSGYIDLISYPGEDIHPDSWDLDANQTYEDSEYSLKLYGNTWKILQIEPYTLDSGSVWQVASYIQSVGRYQGFGLMDEDNVLFYSFAGTTMLDPEEWLHVYQGEFPLNSWNLYQLPVGSDWMAWYQYEPVITQIVFVNDNDNLPSPGVIYFDDILDITSILPVDPLVLISSTDFTVTDYTPKWNPDEGNLDEGKKRLAEVQFFSYVYDPGYDEHFYHWEFGDGTTSNEQHPVHLYQVEDGHLYSVFLAVENPAGRFGFASYQLDPPQGESSLPLTMSFVGDVMLARRMEQPGGVIPTYGVEAVFEPTRHLLGHGTDISVLNLESPLTTATTIHPTKGISFKGHPDNVQGLVYAGIDLVSLANNHILDFMLPGLLETQQVLDDAGILHCGAGSNSYEAYMPAFITRKGITTAFLASSDRTGHYNNYQPYLQAGFNKPGFAYMTPYYVQQQINSVRDVADLVVMYLHSGSEYSLGPISDYDYFRAGDLYPGEEYFDRLDVPKMWDREIRHFMIDNGADLVVNHHPHIIQGVEVYNGKLIAHSLGNFIFDMNRADTMPSMILHAEATDEGFAGFKIIPAFVDNYVPQPATGQLGLYILDYLARRSKELDTYLHIDRDNIRGHVILDTLSMSYADYHSIDSIPLYPSGNLFRSKPLRLNRNGFLSEITDIQPQASYHYRLGRESIWFGNFEDEGCTLWNTSNSSVSYDNSEAYSGNRSLKQVRSAGSGSVTSNISHRITRYENTGHTLHGYIKTQNANNALIQVRYYSTRTGWMISSEDISNPVSGTQDWTFFYKDLSVPSNANFFDIVLSSSGPAMGTGVVWFDDVGLIEWTGWENYYGPSMISNPNDFYYLQLQTPVFNDFVQVAYLEREYSSGTGSMLLSGQVDYEVPLVESKLYKSYPNPFNTETNISFISNNSGITEISIYNVRGQLVRSLFSDFVEPGLLKTILWNGRDNTNNIVSSGVYFYQMRVDNKVISTRKSLLLK